MHIDSNSIKCILNSPFKQTVAFTYTILLKPSALDFLLHVTASLSIVNVVSCTHNTIYFQRHLSLLGV